jgi:hypothetical protein
MALQTTACVTLMIPVGVLCQRAPVSVSNSLTVPSELAEAQLKPPGSQLAPAGCRKTWSQQQSQRICQDIAC